MGDQVPLVMPLDDEDAVAAAVGGKGASLGRLARAGFRVPLGFHVTTGAYLDFLVGGGLREELLSAMSVVDGSDPATFEAAAASIGALFADTTRLNSGDRVRVDGGAGTVEILDRA